MAEELDWDDVTLKENIDSYCASIEHERQAASLPETHLSSLLHSSADQ
jgi:hypothetical protein